MNDGNDKLQSCAKDYWEHVLKHNPTFATYTGDHRYDDLLEDLSEESAAAQIKYIKELLYQAGSIDTSTLTAENTLNHTLLNNTLNNHISFYHFKTRYLPLNHLTGPHIDFPQLIEYHPFNSQKDYENYISRLKAFPDQIDQLVILLQKGIKQKITEFGKTIEHVMGQVESFTQFTDDNHPLIAPSQKIPDHFEEKNRKEIISTIKESVSSHVTPAYKTLYTYLKSEYMLHCRDKEGIWSLPGGPDIYRFLVRYHTTTDLTPDEIHGIGKSEVERITHDIKEIMVKAGFNGSIRGFADYVKSKEGLYPKSRPEIIDGYREILSKMDKRLPDFFGKLPVAEYDIKEIEKYREQAAPAAYYYPPPKDYSRPGYFYVNTYKPEERPKYGMEALAFHEAVPGHHLQIAIMQELRDIPEFRRHEGSTAFIEGWALYAEKLAKEIGFYQDIFSEYGRLTNEIWRAARLVVDTGVHYFQWSREKAMHYCTENTGLEEHEIAVEIDRYIAMPGQALAYKVGELKILDLRNKASEKLGPEFDLKEFHDRLLEHGALPLNVLDRVISEQNKYSKGDIYLLFILHPALLT